MRLCLLDHGRWSGGGAVVLGNLRMLAARFPDILTTQPGTVEVYLVPRNVAPFSLLRTGRFVIMPQNLWAWEGPARGLTEKWWRTRLRLASDVTMDRSLGNVRICSRIPSRQRPVFGLTTNVLDSKFEDALRRSSNVQDVAGGLVYVGSGVAYKNLDNLIEGYRVYRSGGGWRPLHLFVTPPSAESVLRMGGLPAGCRLYLGALERHEVLSAFRSAFAVVFPSQVEASPIFLLEAMALGCRIIASDITGHRETARSNLSGLLFVPPKSPDQFATAMWSAESLPRCIGHFQSTRHLREGAREQWAVGLRDQLSALP
jgi:glycosyltransferase involved in cell wall biosynthesis